MSNQSKTLRDLFASIITGGTINTTTSTATDLIASVVDETGSYLKISTGGGAPGASGSSGSSGVSGSSGTSTTLTPTDISDAYTGATGLYLRASGGTYDIYLPESLGLGGLITIKNLTIGTKTIIPFNTDLIDGVSNKTITTQYTSISLTDSSLGNWDII